VNSMAPKDFVEHLRTRNEHEERPERLYVIGMAKPADKGSDAFLLGPSHRCGPWIPLSVKSVERVVPLTTGDCGEHQHPIVAVYFHDRQDPTGLALRGLLGAMHDDALAQAITGTGTAIARSRGGDGGDGTGQVICACFPLFFCWEVDWTQDYPPGTPPPPAHPTPQVGCSWIPIAICRRIPA
jgi:hypothetical protein